MSFLTRLIQPKIHGRDSVSNQDAAASEAQTLVAQGINAWLGRSGAGYNVWKMAILLASFQSAEYLSNNMMMAKAIKARRLIQKYVVDLRTIPGLILEFGVANGSSVNRMAPLVAPQKIYGFDSFEGLPETWRPDHPKGMFAQELPPVAKNVELVVGWYNESLPGFLSDNPGDVSLLHIDCDLYSSTKTVFDLLRGRIKPGTVILFDEYYNYPGWQNHEFKAFQEFVAENSVSYEYAAFTISNKQVAVIIKSIG